MTNILFAIPMKSDLHPILKRRYMNIVSKLVEATNYHVDVGYYREGTNGQGYNQERYSLVANARNATLDTYLKDYHDYVFWLDSDVLFVSDYDIINKMVDISKCNKSVVGIRNHLDGQMPMWYDIAGYVQGGNWFKQQPPYCKYDRLNNYNNTLTVPGLDSVGLCYLIPACVYQEQRYEITEGYTEHYSVCAKAKELGYNIECILSEYVVHCNHSEYLAHYDTVTRRTFYYQDNITHNHFLYFNEYEVIKYLSTRNDKHVIDIGCNIGIISTFLTLNNNSKVLGIDANKHIIEYALANKEHYKLDNIEYVYGLVATEYRGNDVSLAGLANTSTTYNIPVLSLAEYVHPKHTTLVKIDTDGMDYFILKSLFDLGYNKDIIIEIDDRTLERYKCSSTDIFSLLDEHQYDTLQLDEYNFVCTKRK